MTITKLNIRLTNCWMIQYAIKDEPEAIFYIYEYYDFDHHVFKYYINSIDSESMHYIRTTEAGLKDELSLNRLHSIIKFCQDHDIFTETYYYL